MTSVAPQTEDWKLVAQQALNGEERAFLKATIDIADEEALWNHINEVQEAALKIYGYRCIRRFSFARLKITRLPAYPQVLALGRERPGAIFIDVGTCFGTDLRKVILDGYPSSQALATDIQPQFWNLGHKLFRSSPASFPVPFVAGDIFDTAFVAPASAVTSSLSESTPPPEIQGLTSLTSLRGHVSAIHVSAVFHLFDEARQSDLAHRLGSLLSPDPGSVILGMHAGLPKKGWRPREEVRDDRAEMFCHDPESFTALWEEVFGVGQVRVDARLLEYPNPSGRVVDHLLVWSVTRL